MIDGDAPSTKGIGSLDPGSPMPCQAGYRTEPRAEPGDRDFRGTQDQQHPDRGPGGDTTEAGQPEQGHEPVATGVVFVVGAEMTSKGAAKAALEQLDSAKAKSMSAAS